MPTSTPPPVAWRLPEPTDPAVCLDLLVRPDEVGGLVAWRQLVRDRVLVPVWDDAAVPGRRTVTPVVRALAVRPDVPDRCTVAGRSAAWILAGTVCPALLEVVYPPGARRPRPHRARVPRQAAVLRAETQLVAGVLVTAPLRTALDVAASAPRDEAVATVRALREHCGLDVGVAARSLELRYRWPRRDHVRQVLAEVSAS